MAPVAMRAQLSAGTLGGLTVLRPRGGACSRRPVSVRAAATGPGSRKPKDLAQQLQQYCDAFFQVVTTCELNSGLASSAMLDDVRCMHVETTLYRVLVVEQPCAARSLFSCQCRLKGSQGTRLRVTYGRFKVIATSL